MGSVELSLDLGGIIGPFVQGETFEVTVSMDNPYPVAGIELHLDDTPESVTLVQVDPAGVLAKHNTRMQEIIDEGPE